MPEISDQLLLHVNGELRLIPEEAVLQARKRQVEAMTSGGQRRTLIEILRAEGLLDSETESRIRAHPSVRTVRLLGRQPSRPADDPESPPLLVVAPELGLSPPTPLITFTPPAFPPGENPVLKPPTRPRPADVEEAEKEERNRVGPFILVEEVGRGGTGRVHRAWDNLIGRFVALKVISSNDPEVRQRCVREAQIAGRLSHPAIATVFQAGEDRGSCYIAMQFIDGAQIGAGPLPMETTVALIRDSARALSYAHEQGIVHRDVKPGNLMIDKKGRIFLTDFGLAKEVMGGFGTHVSISGTVLGTPSYMSPEQAAGRVKEIDYRSDIYSLGATLYALLAGRPPFVGDGISAILMAVVNRKPPPLSRFNAAVSPELEMAVGRAMAKDPARRYPSMGAFADELDRLLHEKRFTGRYGWAKLMARRWAPVAAAAIVFGIAARVLVDRLARPSTSSPSFASADAKDPLPGLRQDAALALQDIELNCATLTPERRGERVRREVMDRLDKVLKEEQGDVEALVTRSRALYVDGRGNEAAAALGRLSPKASEDYRVPLVRAFLAADAGLATPVPLPALEAPFPAWEAEPPPWPEAVARDLRGLKMPEGSGEHDADRAAIRGLQRLAEGRWGEAADALAEARRTSSLPVLVRAWTRAAYLSRRFHTVRGDPGAAGLRERLGAGIALALEAPSPAEALGSLLKEAGADAWAATVLRVALARCESGTDPAPHASAALDRLKGGGRPAVELAAAVEAARLRWRALSAGDAESDYRKALEALGSEPVTWAGKLAAVELRLGLGSRMVRHRAEGRPLLEEAVRLAGELTKSVQSWSAPRVLRAAGRLRLEQIVEALAELDDLARRPESGVRAFLVGASARLRVAEQRRKDGHPAEDDAQRARELAAKALAAEPGHPEGAVLAAAALLAAAKGELAETVATVVAETSRALERAPGYVDAAFLRGRVRLWAGLADALAGGDARPHFAAASADLDAVLRAVPEFAPALKSRGVVRFHLGRYDEALADWKKAVELDPSLDTADLRADVRHAEDRRRGR